MTSVTSGKSRTESQAETRARLLGAAVEVFAERGFFGASIEAIATRAGFTRGAVYANFADKDDLFVTLLDEYTSRRAEVIGDMANAAGSTGEFLSKLRNEPRQRSEDVNRTWFMLRVEHWLHAMRDPTARERLVIHDRAVRDKLAQAVDAQAKAAGLDVPAPTAFIAEMIRALELGMLLDEHLDPETVPRGSFPEALELLTEALLALAREQTSPTSATRTTRPAEGMDESS